MGWTRLDQNASLFPAVRYEKNAGALRKDFYLFRKIYIEITTTCNRSCEFCPGTSRPARFMEKDLFGRILEQVRGMGKLLHFHVMGEPLLHPDLPDFLDMCAPYGYRVNVVTNGVLLPSVADVMMGKRALRQISVSLHHLSESSPADEVDAYFEGLTNFIRKARVVPGLFVSFRLWNRPAAVDNIFWDGMTSRVAEMFSLSRSLVDQCTEKAPVRLAENMWLNCGRRFEWPTLRNPDYGSRGTCLGLRDQIGILVDGTVVPCCLDSEGTMALGNVQSVSLRNIVNGSRARAISEGFSKGNIVESLCRRCSYRLRFTTQGRGE